MEDLTYLIPFLPFVCLFAAVAGGGLIILFVIWRIQIAKRNAAGAVRAVGSAAMRAMQPRSRNSVHVNVRIPAPSERVQLAWLRTIHIVLLAIGIVGGLFLLIVYAPAGAGTLILTALAEGVVQIIRYGVRRLTGTEEKTAIERRT